MPERVEPALVVDASAVGLRELRERVARAVEQSGRRVQPFDRYWDLFGHAETGVTLPKRTLVVGDLSRIMKQYAARGRHGWIAAVREHHPYFLAFVRTRGDERSAAGVDDLLRHSDLRVTLCKRPEDADHLTDCVVEALAALQPDSLVDVRYSKTRGRFRVEFGDGISAELEPMAVGVRPEDALLESATIGAGGRTLEISSGTGGLYEIHVSAVRAAVGRRFADRVSTVTRNPDMEIGERVRQARLEAGLTQSRLAELSGIDQAVVSRLERGQHSPRLRTLERVAQALGLSPSTLLRR